MGLLRRGADAPRVVGFDFGNAPAAPPRTAPAPTWAAPVPAAPVQPVPVAGAVLAPPAPPAPAPNAPDPFAPPPLPYHHVPAKRAGTGAVVAIVAGAVVAVVAFVAVGLSLAGGGARRATPPAVAADVPRPAVTAPAVVDGARRVTEGPLLDLATDIEPGFQSTETGELVTGLYARGDQPAFVLVAGTQRIAPKLMHSWFAEAARDSGMRTAGLRPVGDLACAPSTGNGMTLWACFWSGPLSSGYVYDVTGEGEREAARMTRLVRTAVEL